MKTTTLHPAAPAEFWRKDGKRGGDAFSEPLIDFDGINLWAAEIACRAAADDCIAKFSAQLDAIERTVRVAHAAQQAGESLHGGEVDVLHKSNNETTYVKAT